MVQRQTEFAYHNIELYKSESLGSGSYGGVCKAKCDGLLCAATSFPPPNSTLYDRCFINTTSPDSSELVIYNPRPEDEGTYMCTVVNTVGETMSSIYLKVQGTYINHE